MTILTDSQISKIKDSQPVIFISGVAGSGKTNKGVYLKDALGLPHLDMSKLLEQNFHSMEPGVFADINLVRSIITQVICENPTGFILSGFPRTVEQSLVVGGLLRSKNKEFLLVNLRLTNDQAIGRLMNRCLSHPERSLTGDEIAAKVALYCEFIYPAIEELKEYTRYPLISVDTEGSKEAVNRQLFEEIYQMLSPQKALTHV